jgi:spore maturation protein CgeB
LLEAQVPAIKRPGAVAAFWDVDAPAALDRLDADPDDPFRALIPAYDIVLTYGGGPPVVAGYRRFGARSCVPIYNGLDPAMHHPTAPEPGFACDLGLVANRLPDREKPIEEFFLAVAADLPGRHFLLGGNGWSDKPMPANVGYLGHVYTRDHNAFNVSAGAVLNVSRDSMAAYGFSPATRVFEAAGAGPASSPTHGRTSPGSSSPAARSWLPRTVPRVAEQVARLNPERARRIGIAGRARALADHTYAQHVALLQQVLEGIEP